MSRGPYRRRTTPQPRLFDTLSKAERHIRHLRTCPENLGRQFAVHSHPKRPHAFAVAIMAGPLLWGYVPETGIVDNRGRRI